MKRRHGLIENVEEPVFDGTPSRTQVKKAAEELQRLGVELLELPEAVLEKLEMNERLRTALHDLRKLAHKTARARQAQFVGKLMRDEDVEPYRRALTELREGRVRDMRALREVERWRQRLLTEADGLKAWLSAYPSSDEKTLATLVADAKRERALAEAMAQRTHREPENGPRYRELFKVLRDGLLKR